MENHSDTNMPSGYRPNGVIHPPNGHISKWTLLIFYLYSQNAIFKLEIFSFVWKSRERLDKIWKKSCSFEIDSNMKQNKKRGNLCKMSLRLSTAITRISFLYGVYDVRIWIKECSHFDRIECGFSQRKIALCHAKNQLKPPFFGPRNEIAHIRKHWFIFGEEHDRSVGILSAHNHQCYVISLSLSFS